MSTASAALSALERDAQRLIDIGRILDAENARLTSEVKKVSDQLLDARDEIYVLNVKLRERDEIIAELQQVSSMRRTGR